ncbi:agmatine deiminase family protein [Pseudoblastomonas halimionae]|uniref:Agmatine deiminase n=1 Tax=Alteriqipengyuania halimionae TaxID=1926630 RepID=A0A6I4U8J8_9SPHN|nr:agmatine deiminase family protein [Alteriqipengyuania halimionae]MXP10671.1 agmatine deiminase [Alteriqipengyuania halimionae]
MTRLLPPEWAPQDWLWIGFPHEEAEWPGVIARAQEQIAAYANAVAESGQEVRLLVRDAANEARAKSLVSAGVTLERRRYGDIWIRDTGPLTVIDAGERRALRFGFNGWGGKYLMDGDREIGADIARDAGLPVEEHEWILEGGAIDVDGAGHLVTTAQCVPNANRNADFSCEDAAARMREAFGVDDVIWLGDGLVNDHTDGHVDNLARFVAPNALALPVPSGADDPNAGVYADARARIGKTNLSLFDVPSPGRITMGDEVVPASYMNFAITNALVVVPTYGSVHDAEAVSAIAELFPGRETIGLQADAVLAGGGSFHCASMQMPSEPD